MADPLPGVIHYNRELIGVQTVLAPDHKVTELCSQRDVPAALNCVIKRDAGRSGNRHADRRGALQGALTLAAVADATAIWSQLLAAALAMK